MPTYHPNPLTVIQHEADQADFLTRISPPRGVAEEWSRQPHSPQRWTQLQNQPRPRRSPYQKLLVRLLGAPRPGYHWSLSPSLKAALLVVVALGLGGLGGMVVVLWL